MLLALYPDVQKRMREEVLQIWPSPDDFASSSYKRDSDKLVRYCNPCTYFTAHSCLSQEYTLAVFRETLRCFPSEPRLNKVVDADAVLTGTRFTPTVPPKVPELTFDGGLTNVELKRDELTESKFSVHIPKGSVVTMDIWATHMNRMYL